MNLYKPVYPAKGEGYSPTYKNQYLPDSHIVVGQKFGENATTIYAQLGLKGHNGIDIPCPRGTPIFAAHDGTVIKLSTQPTYGLGITLQSTDGTFKTIYWHLQNILVSVGQNIKAFDLIGLSDSTGQSTGDHLHFGLYPANEPKDNGFDGAVDPMPFIIQTPTFNFPNNLFIGKESEGVKNLQICLANEGFLGDVGFYGFTGFFGTQTFGAVQSFQKKYGILNTGFCGAITRQKLNEIYN